MICANARAQALEARPASPFVFQVTERLPSVSRIRTWGLAGMERLWSQWAPRRQTGEIVAVAVDAVRSRRELVLENAVLRPPGQRAATPQQAPEAPPR